jgi:radical SAM superfamily enzyme YgiQ (UPF0313 family)
MPTNNKISLLLVMPPQLGLLRGFATGLISIANYVSLHAPNVEVNILDLSEASSNGLHNEINQSIRKTTGKLFVGITTTTGSYQSALKTARVFKEIAPDCVVIFGGHHASADAETVLKRHPEEVDFVVIGEGEIPIVELLRNYPDVHAVPGLAYLEGNEFFENQPAPLLERGILDTLPITFRGNGLRSSPGKFEHVTYVSARGCPLHCSFCSVADQPMRTKSPQRVKQDIRELVEMGFRKIAIEDNFFAHSFLRTTEVCVALRELREELGNVFSWDCQTRVESMTVTGIVPLMESAGCEAVYIGVESLNEDSLLYLGKTIHPARYLAQLLDIVIPRLLDSKIDCYLNIQFGIPQEKSEHYDRTYQVLKRIAELANSKGKVVTIFPQLFVIYPGTNHFKEGIKKGLFKAEVFESFTKWEMEEEPIRVWLGEYFAHGVGGLPIGILEASKIPLEKYIINPAKVAEVDAMIRRIEDVRGLKVFHYGSYLTTGDTDRTDNRQTSRDETLLEDR